MSNSSSPRKVRCPQCGQAAEYSPDNPFRPFCSERCRLIDLGEWASENFRVPTQDESAGGEKSDVISDESTED